MIHPDIILALQEYIYATTTYYTAPDHKPYLPRLLTAKRELDDIILAHRPEVYLDPGAGI